MHHYVRRVVSVLGPKIETAVDNGLLKNAFEYFLLLRVKVVNLEIIYYVIYM